jgi:transposase
LRRLVRYREQLTGIRRNAKLRVGALLREHRIGGYAGCRWTLKWLTWLHKEALPAMPESSRWIVERQSLQINLAQREIARVHQRLRQVTADDAVVADLRAQAGVGEWTAWVLRAEIGQFERFRSGKSLSRFCGISPRNASSGQRQADAGLIKAGAPLLRATLIELAQRLCRMPGRWREMKQQLRAAGKPASLATAAVANRWMRWLYHEMLERQRQRREQTATPTAVVQGDNDRPRSCHKTRPVQSKQ